MEDQMFGHDTRVEDVECDSEERVLEAIVDGSMTRFEWRYVPCGFADEIDVIVIGTIVRWDCPKCGHTNERDVALVDYEDRRGGR